MSEHGALFSEHRSRTVPAAPAWWSRAVRVLRAGPSPSASAAPGPRSVLLRVAVVLVAVGIFTMSWDRLLNVQVASYNVKLPSLVFSLAALTALVGAGRPLAVLLERGPRRAVMTITAVLLAYELIRGAFSAAPTAAVAQVVAVLSGAVLPAVAVLLVVRSRKDLRWALSWLMAGAVAASLFGLYQLFAFYVGLPQGIPYTGVGIGTGIGRISAFNYEPAYFGYYIVLALGAWIALRRLDGGEIGWRSLIAFGAILYLANVRALPLVAIALGILLLLAFRRNRRLVLRGAVVLVATVVLALLTPVAVSAAGQAVSNFVPAQQEAGPGSGPDPQQAEQSPSSEEGEGPSAGVQSQLQAVNPNEQSSNAPRLGLYQAVLRQVAADPVFGLGAGNLGPALQRNALSAIQDQIGGQVVANNIWLQALADGGVVQLLMELALVVVVLVAAVKRRSAAVFPMAAAWLAVVGVGGMLTSYFFDIKVWVVLALVLVGLAAGRAEQDRSAPAAVIAR